jgi:hypothetical protein
VFLNNDSLYEHLAGRGLASCLVCGSENTEIDPQAFPLRSMKPDDMPGEPTGLTQLTAMLICRDCGFIRLHAVTTATPLV